MRMLEVFSSENTYLPVLQDAHYVASIIEQILHYVIQKGLYNYWLSDLCKRQVMELILLSHVLLVKRYLREVYPVFKCVAL